MAELNSGAKYKYGTSEIDLSRYIHNLGTNVSGWLNSQNLNEGQKQEFMAAYDRLIKAYQDLLTNNTNRFSTNDFGVITDTLGEFSDIDNDGIDPVGSEYYYDNNGNRITTDDYNLLKRRKLKNYNTFSANRMVARYFKEVGDAVRKYEADKANPKTTSNPSGTLAFDISKDGFVPLWLNRNNPSGGDFDYTPYAALETVGEDGTVGTSWRANYLAEQLRNYASSGDLNKYDFSNSTFGSREAYQAALNKAAESLVNGYDPKDIMALNLAGIGSDFLNLFFGSGLLQLLTLLETPELKEARELEERMNADKAKRAALLEIKEAKLYFADRDREDYFDKWLLEHPFLSTISGSIPIKSLSRKELDVLASNAASLAGLDYKDRENWTDSLTKIYLLLLLNYVNFNNINKILRSGNKRLINNNLEGFNEVLLLATENNLLNGQYAPEGNSILGKDWYVLPNSEDYNNYSFIAYNPTTGEYLERSMLLNELLRKAMAYDYYNRNIAKHQSGGMINDLYKSLQIARERKEATKLREELRRDNQESRVTLRIISGESEELAKANEKFLSDSLSTGDILRIVSLALDTISAGSSFVPIYGTAISAGTGLASTVNNLIADINDLGLTSGLAWRNFGFSLGMDAMGLIPGLGVYAKATKAARVLKPLRKTIMYALNTLGTYEAMLAAPVVAKLFDSPKDVTAEDLRNLVLGLSGLAGLQRGVRGKLDRLNNTRVKDLNMLTTESGKQIILTDELLDTLRRKKGLEELNKYLLTLFPGEKLTSSFKSTIHTKSGKMYGFKTGPDVISRHKEQLLPNRERTWYGVYRVKPKATTERPTTTGLLKTTSEQNKLSQDFSNVRALVPVTQKPFTYRDDIVVRGELAAAKQRADIVKRRNESIEKIDDGPSKKYTDRYVRVKKYLEERKLRPYREKFLAELDESEKGSKRAESIVEKLLIKPKEDSRSLALLIEDRIPGGLIYGRARTKREKEYREIFAPIAEKEQQEIWERAISSLPALWEINLRAADATLSAITKARQRAELALKNVLEAINKYGIYAIPTYKPAATGAERKRILGELETLFNGRRYEVKDALRHRELPHKLSNKKKKTSRDDKQMTRRKEGGTLNLNKVRKYQNSGLFELILPDWYANTYKLKSLTGWNNTLGLQYAAPSITNPNAGHYRAGNLLEAYLKNNSYTSNPNIVGLDILSYYDNTLMTTDINLFVANYNRDAEKIRGFWNTDHSYNDKGVRGHNLLFRTMFTNRSDDSNNSYNIGYLSKMYLDVVNRFKPGTIGTDVEDTMGSSTWLRRMDTYEKEFDLLTPEELKSRVHTVTLSDGKKYLVYKKANGDIAVLGLPESSIANLLTSPSLIATLNPSIRLGDSSNVIPAEEPSTKTSSTLSNGLNLSWLRNPTLIYGLPRAVYADYMNRRITNLAKDSLTPFLKDPLLVHRYTRSDLDAEMRGERNYAALRRLASRPLTSDGRLQIATLLEAESKGLEARNTGMELSNLVLRLYDELAWQLEKENATNRYDTAMFNRALIWATNQDKSKLELAYLYKKHNIWDTLGKQFEYEDRQNLEEKKALTDNFARSDISNAVDRNLGLYAPELSSDAVVIWNQVMSGSTTPSKLSADPLKWQLYQLAYRAASEARSNLLRQYYGIPQSRYNRVRLATPYTITIAKDGAKLQIAGIKAKTADAERFLRLIKASLDRHQKEIERLSKSMYGIIKSAQIK